MTAARPSAPLWIVALVAVIFLLREAQPLLVPIALAALISYAIHPLVARLERLHIPRAIGAALVVSALVGVCVWGVAALRDDFLNAAERLPRQVRALRQQWEATEGGTFKRLRDSIEEVQQATLPGRQPGELTPATAAEVAPVVTNGSGATGLGTMIWQRSNNLVEFAGNALVIVFLVFFLLVGAPAWRRRITSVAGDTLSSKRTAVEVLDEITRQIQRFLIARAITGVIVGVATWLALLYLDAPAAGLWGLFAGVLNSIPYFGPVIVSAGLAVVGLFAGGLGMAVQLAAVALVITSIEGWLLTPPLLGRAARLNTLSVFLGILLWTWMWGIWGTVLAVPLLSIVKAVCDHVERFEPVARLLEE